MATKQTVPQPPQAGAKGAPETNGRSGSGDAPGITKEQLIEFQRQAQAQEQQTMQALIVTLQGLAAEQGFEIIAIPQLLPDGRLSAVWGVRRPQQ